MKNYKLFTILVLLIWLPFGSFSQLNIHELNKKLGQGVNFGNMFEAPSEAEWGNPFNDEYVKIIAEQGFKHIRIPVRWDVPARAMQAPPYTINAEFLKRIKHVVDLALAQKLMVVLNMHHHAGIFENPAANKDKFLAQWTQIAEYFKDYDQNLLFEVMNEPNTNLTPELWNQYFADALTLIRKTNPNRAVLMGVAEWGGVSALPKLQPPTDANLILTVHYYNPFPFTHQGAEWVSNSAPWLGTKWENTEAEQSEIQNDVADAVAFAKKHQIPLHFGEFGSYSKADMASRVLWSSYLARYLESQNISWAYWDFSAGFGFYNPSTKAINKPLLDALLKNPMPPAKILNTKVLYASNFATANGWNLNLQQAAQGSFTQSNGQAVVSIEQASAEGWHAQFAKQNIALRKGLRYIVSFRIQSDVPASITTYLGRDGGNYMAYSDYKGINVANVNKKIFYSFKMNEPDDPKARMVFDLGKTKAKLQITEIKIEEEISDNATVDVPIKTEPIVLAAEHELVRGIKVGPNPARGSLQISGLQQAQSMELLSTQGYVVYKKIKPNVTEVIDIQPNTIGASLWLKVYFENNAIFVKRILLQ
jgi:endoglucanase